MRARGDGRADGVTRARLHVTWTLAELRSPHGGFHPSRAASPRALMWAMDWIEIWGLTPEAVGKLEPSITYRSRTSQVWPVGSQAEIAGDPPIRALPMMWNEPSVIWPAP